MKRPALAAAALLVLLLGGMLVLLPLVAVASLAAAPGPDPDGGRGEICSAGDAGTAQIPEEYREDVANAARVSGISQEVIASQIFQESNWNPNVTSPSGARGLAQFKDDTWPQFGNGGDPYNGHDAIAAQGRFLAWLKNRFQALANGDEEALVKMVLSGYRLGFNVVEAAGGIPDHPASTSYWTEILARTSIYTTDCTPVFAGEDIVVSGDWTHPLPGSYFTSAFGLRGCIPGVGCDDFIADHNGLDFATAGGPSTVRAATAMTVTAISNNAASGVYVRGRQISEPGYVMTYLHCAAGSVRVSVGDTTQAGQALCTEGATGYATGVHLHFGIARGSAADTNPARADYIDPRPILEANGVEVCPPGRDTFGPCATR